MDILAPPHAVSVLPHTVLVVLSSTFPSLSVSEQKMATFAYGTEPLEFENCT